MLVFGLSTFPILLLTALSAGSLTKSGAEECVNSADFWPFNGVLSILKGISANGWIPEFTHGYGKQG